MRPTIVNQQWKVHSQVKTKHFIWIFYLAVNGGFSEQLFRIWHDNREERTLPYRAPSCTLCLAGTRTQIAQDVVRSWASFYFSDGADLTHPNTQGLWGSVVTIVLKVGQKSVLVLYLVEWLWAGRFPFRVLTQVRLFAPPDHSPVKAGLYLLMNVSSFSLKYTIISLVSWTYVRWMTFFMVVQRRTYFSM